MQRMKERMTVSLDGPLAQWLRAKAAADNTNVSGCVEAAVRDAALRESLDAHARFFADRDDMADLEAEYDALSEDGR